MTDDVPAAIWDKETYGCSVWSSYNALCLHSAAKHWPINIIKAFYKWFLIIFANVNDAAATSFFDVHDEYWSLILLSTVIKFRTSVM